MTAAPRNDPSSARRRLTRIALPAIVCAIGLAGPGAFAGSAAAAAEPIDLTLYGELLEKHTRVVDDLAGTRVDYGSLRASADWKRLVQQVHAAKPNGLSRNTRLAFWINAYNILAIDLVVQHYPVSGIKKIGSFFSPVWDLEVATIDGRSVSLGAIEHEILRKMNEPFIHGAIICASLSCPPLARTPFRADHIRDDMNAAMRAWLMSREKGIALDRANRTIRISKIFDWFEEDFDARGGVLKAIAEFLPPDDARWVRNEGAKASIEYFDYDWSLNDWK